MSESYRDAKAVLDIVKSSAWGFFKFRVSGEDIDKSFVHCKLCLDAGQKKKVQIKYCGGTTKRRKVSSTTLVVAKAKQCQSGSSPVKVGRS